MSNLSIQPVRPEACSQMMRLVARLRRRLIAVRAGESAVAGLAIAMSAALPVMLVGWFLPEVSRVETAVAAAAAGLLMGGWAGLRGRPTPQAAAAAVDRRCRMQSALATAADLAGGDHPFAEPVCRDALERYQQADGDHVPLGSRSPMWGRLAAVAGLLTALAALMPAGLFAGRRSVEAPHAPDEWEPHMRQLSGGGGEPTTESIKAAVAQMKASGEVLKTPDIDPDKANIEFRKIDKALREAIAQLPREAPDPDQRQRLEAFLQRAERLAALRAAETAPPNDPAAASVKDATKPAAKSGAGGPSPAAKAGGGDVTSSAGSGGAGETRPVAPLPPASTPADFAALWERAARADASRAPDSELAPRYRELVKRFNR